MHGLLSTSVGEAATPARSQTHFTETWLAQELASGQNIADFPSYGMATQVRPAARAAQRSM